MRNDPEMDHVANHVTTTTGVSAECAMCSTLFPLLCAGGRIPSPRVRSHRAMNALLHHRVQSAHTLQTAESIHCTLWRCMFCCGAKQWCTMCPSLNTRWHTQSIAFVFHQLELYLFDCAIRNDHLSNFMHYNYSKTKKNSKSSHSWINLTWKVNEP